MSDDIEKIRRDRAAEKAARGVSGDDDANAIDGMNESGLSNDDMDLKDPFGENDTMDLDDELSGDTDADEILHGSDSDSFLDDDEDESFDESLSNEEDDDESDEANSNSSQKDSSGDNSDSDDSGSDDKTDDESSDESDEDDEEKSDDDGEKSKSLKDIFDKKKKGPIAKANQIKNKILRSLAIAVATAKAAVVALFAYIMMKVIALVKSAIATVIAMVKALVGIIVGAAKTVAITVATASVLSLGLAGAASVGGIIGVAYLVTSYNHSVEQKALDDNVGSMCGDETTVSGPVTEGDISGGFGGGDWTKKGSSANKRVEAIFNYYVSKGMSGAGAAGAIGNSGVETGQTFNPLLVEAGGRTQSVPSALNPSNPYYSAMEGVILYPDAADITGEVGTNGYGIYQMSPGAKLASPHLQGKNGYKYQNVMGRAEGKITPKMRDDALLAAEINNQNDFIWLVAETAATMGGLHATMNRNSTYLNMVANASSPEEGAWGWYYVVENAGQLQGSYDKKDMREGIARKAYDMFDGSKYKYDASKFQASGGSGEVAEGATSNGSSNSSMDECDNGEMASAGGNGELGGGPIDILESQIGTVLNGGQCYGMTAYYVEKMGGPAMMGTGHVAAADIGIDYDWEKYGWTVILNPKVSDLRAGDVINWKRSSYYSGTSGFQTHELYGHTAVLAEVHEGGKLSIYDQNPHPTAYNAFGPIYATDDTFSSLVRKGK